MAWHMSRIVRLMLTKENVEGVTSVIRDESRGVYHGGASGDRLQGEPEVWEGEVLPVATVPACERLRQLPG